MRRRGRTQGRVEHVGPFGLQELEGVGHAGSQQIVPQLGRFPLASATCAVEAAGAVDALPDGP